MLLAKDGIFPIIRDKSGNLLSQLPASGFHIPGTIQGEGKLCGIPSLFIRLAGCNLSCCWHTSDGGVSVCDTAYASLHPKGAYSVSIEEIEAVIRQNTGLIRHIVITGGEPFLQAEELKSLCQRLKKDHFYHLTIETNATLFCREVVAYIDLFSLSPKLPSSQSLTSRPGLYPDCIQQFIDYALKFQKDYQLKFVYSCEEDIQAIKDLLSQLKHWKNTDILLMPLGGTPALVKAHARKTLEHCLRNGWRYCDRLHLSLFGDLAGV